MLLHAITLAIAAAGPDPSEHIAVVGASASAGWGVVVPTKPTDHRTPINHRHVDLADVLPAVLGRERSEVSGHADIWFFSQPHSIGAAMVEAAEAEGPGHVVALDFLFWFAYGSADRQGDPLATDDVDARLANLNHGLQLLESIDVPLVVGDIPDVSGAADVWPIALLRHSQIPSASALAAMNGRVADWAASRANTTLIPLAATVERMKQGGPLQLNDHAWPADAPLIQFDQLHPTTLGLVALAELTAESLPQSAKPSVCADPQVVLHALTETPP